MRQGKHGKAMDAAGLRPVASLVADAAGIADALVMETSWSRNRSAHLGDMAAYARIHADDEHAETAIAELCQRAGIPLAKAIRISDTLRDLPRHATGMANVAQNLRAELDEAEFACLLETAEIMSEDGV